jgi:hypothetical protein
MRTG